MRKWSSERGISLVEATIILTVLAILTSVLAPSFTDYIEDANAVKAKEDVEVLGVSVQRLLRDTGFPAMRVDGATAHTLANRVDLLYSTGATPTAAGADYTNAGIQETLNWDAEPAGNVDTLEEQLVLNGTTPYTAPTAFQTRGKGWRGSYLNAPAGADPWGNRYSANTAFLAVATDAPVGAAEGQRSGGWTKDVIVVSAGRDGIVQTLFEGTAGSGTSVAGSDDVVFTIQGNTR